MVALRVLNDHKLERHSRKRVARMQELGALVPFVVQSLILSIRDSIPGE